MKFSHKRIYLASGLILTGVFWWVNWAGQGLRTHWAFFPLWLGYIFSVDAMAALRGRLSMVLNRPLLTAALFGLSVPLWWLFEWMNERAGYWKYLPEDAFGPVEHAFWSTVCFSTVVPAVFVTVNLLLSFQLFQKHTIKLRVAGTPAGRWAFFVVGWMMLAAMMLWPEYGMAFMWISLYFIIDPVNVWLGKPALMGHTRYGDWRMVVILFSAALICGFFWELWNWYAWPKWIYTFPYLDGLKIFEMPLAGYLGYLPFGLEIWAMTVLFFPAFGRKMLLSLETKT